MKSKLIPAIAFAILPYSKICAQSKVHEVISITVTESFENKKDSKIIIVDGKSEYKIILLEGVQFKKPDNGSNLTTITKTIGDYLKDGYTIASAVPFVQTQYFRQTTYILTK